MCPSVGPEVCPPTNTHTQTHTTPPYVEEEEDTSFGEGLWKEDCEVDRERGQEVVGVGGGGGGVRVRLLRLSQRKKR